MQVNLSSLSSSYASTRTTQTARTGPTDADKAKLFSDMDSDGDGNVSKSEFTSFQPSSTPGQFNVQRSTSQLAQASGRGGPPPGPPPGGMGGPGGPGGAQDDPIQSLDSNADGSVSSDEFGLDKASDEVKALYAAIDGNSDGALSTDEISSFREQMQSQMQSQRQDGDQDATQTTQQSRHPHGPPPQDASEMIRQIAARYAETQASSSTTTATAALSVTA